MWNWTENQIILVFIRHGETKANEEKRYLGITEESLSQKGREDLLKSKRKKNYPDIEYLFVSPMKRCLETARILYPNLEYTIIPEWKEINFGRFEYKNYQELKKDREYQIWLDSKGTLPFPKGESREEFLLRCEKGFVKMYEKLYKKVEQAKYQINENFPLKVGMIVHGGTIMALLSKHGGGDYFDYQISNGEGYLCHSRGLGSSARFTEWEKL